MTEPRPLQSPAPVERPLGRLASTERLCRLPGNAGSPPGHVGRGSELLLDRVVTVSHRPSDERPAAASERLLHPLLHILEPLTLSRALEDADVEERSVDVRQDLEALVGYGSPSRPALESAETPDRETERSLRSPELGS